MSNTYTAEYDTDIKQEVSTYKPYRFHKCEKWCLFAIHSLDKCMQPIQSIFFSNSLKLNKQLWIQNHVSVSVMK